MHFELDRRLDEAQLEELAGSVRSVLGDVRRAVLDFPAMADRGRRMVQLASAGAARYADDEVDETVAFLEWLLQDHFIFLGYREYRIEDETLGVVPGSGLGILADEASSAYARPRSLADLPDEVRERALEGDLLIVSKTNRLSTVHRRTRMDYVGIRKIGPDGRVTGEARMLGLFTSKAYAEPASQTPLLNRKLRQILRHEDLIEGSHDYKTAVALFDSFPKDELFAARTDDLRRAVVALLALEGDRVRLLGRRSPDGRAVSLIAALPADRYDPELVGKLRGAAVPALRRGLRRDAHGARRVRAGPDPRHRARARRACPTSRSRSSSASSSRSPARGRTSCASSSSPRRAPRAGPSWPPAGARASPSTTAPRSRPSSPWPTSAASSGSSARACRSSSACRTRRSARAWRSTSRAARSSSATRCRRSRISACASIEEVPTRLLGGDGETWVQDFGVLGPDGGPLDLDAVGDRVADCITAVRRGDTESDTLNRLVLVAGPRLAPDQRAARLPHLPPADRLALHPGLPERRAGGERRRHGQARALLRGALRPRARPRDEAAEEALREEILADLDAVASLDHDRILRNQLGLIDATLRTNAYKPGRDVIAFKLRSARRARDPAARAALRDLRLLAGDGGHPPARRQGRARRPALVGPPGLPHGGLRADARAGDQERGDRPRRRQGRLLPQGPAGRPRGAQGRGRAPVRPLRRRPARAHGQPRRGRGRPPGARAGARRGRHVPRRRRRQGHGDVLRHGERRLGASAASGSATRSPPAARRATTTRRSGSPRAARGSRSSATSPSSTTTSRRSPSPWSASATCPATCSATGCCCSEQIRLVAAYDHRHVFIDPDPDAGDRASPSASGSSSSRAPRGTTTTASKLSEGGGVWPARGQVDHALPAGARGAGDRGRAAHAQRRHPRDPARAGRPALERRHRHGGQGLGGDRRGREGPRLGRDPRRRAATCAAA